MSLLFFSWTVSWGCQCYTVCVYKCCTEVITSEMAYYFVQLIYFYSI